MTRTPLDALDVHPFWTCPVCGDDLALHAWLDLDLADRALAINDCDRAVGDRPAPNRSAVLSPGTTR